jgi:hypothetical protein
VLNAKQHEREAHIVENAGQLGQVMIATNMAGRGTDIKLGRSRARRCWTTGCGAGIAPRTVTVDMTDEQLRERCTARSRRTELEEEEARLRADAVTRRTGDEAAPALGDEAHVAGDRKQIEAHGAESCARRSTSTGRFLLHRIRWFTSWRTWAGCTSSAPSATRPSHRQPAARPVGPSGRQGLVRFFVVARRRPDEAVRGRDAP